MKRLASAFLFILAVASQALGAPSKWGQLNSEAESLYKKGWYAKGIVAGQAALKTAEKEKSALHIAQTLVCLGKLYTAAGNPDNAYKGLAENSVKRALAIYEKNLGPNDLMVAKCLNQLAMQHIDDKEVGPLLKRALDITERKLGDESHEMAPILVSLALWSKYQSVDHLEIEKIFSRALNIAEKALGPESAAVADVLEEYGHFHANNGDKDKERYRLGVELLTRASRIRAKIANGTYPDEGYSLAIIGSVLYWQSLQLNDKDRYVQAKAIKQTVVQVRERELGHNHPLVADALEELAYFDEEKAPASAEALYRRALAIREQADGPDDVLIIPTLRNLGWMCYVQGRGIEGRSLYQRSLEIAEKYHLQFVVEKTKGVIQRMYTPYVKQQL